MKQRMIPLIILLFLLLGCGSTAPATGRELTMMHVSRSVAKNVNVPPLERIISDQQAVQKLYHAVQALPHVYFPKNVTSLSCPHAYDVSYQVDFFSSQTRVLSVFFQLGGCNFLKIDSQDERTYDGQFLRLFEQTTGISAFRFIEAVGGSVSAE